jgi:hypothetical protein
VIEIKDRRDGRVLYRSDHAASVCEALTEAAHVGCDLGGAALGGADLASAWLGSAKLSGADLGGADLSFAQLASVGLRGANLASANLSSANLASAELAGARLTGAYLRGANFSSANLRGADLRGAYLRGGDFSSADLGGASLRGANLSSAHLGSADLSDADLTGADLAGAHLTGALGLAPERVNDLAMLLDQVGPVRAYKLVNACGDDRLDQGVVGTLPWCLRAWEPGDRMLIVEFEAADIIGVPAGDGELRVSRCRVVGEKELDPVKLGLVSDES